MKQLLTFIIIGLLLTACSTGKNTQPDSPERYFQEGEEFMEKGLYNEALTSWEKVRDSFFSPELTMLAELKIAETYYQSERFSEAASAYNDFLQQYPGTEKSGSVLYWLGMSYYQQILDIDRDQTATKNALKVFRDLLRRHPDERDEAEISPMIKSCLDRLAAHEIYVGRFYLRSKSYPSAVKRLEAALQQFPDYAHRDEAYFYLLSAYLKLEKRTQAETIFNQLSNDYPSSEFISKAQKKLAK